MKKVMFVCHGNICRSPMAEFVFKDLVKKQGRADEFYIESSATSSEELGNPVYPPARRELLKHGIDPAGKFAKRVNHSDYEKFDLFICMDKNNYRNLLRIFGSDKDGKVKMLMDWVGGGEVADPWYTGNFEITYNDILKAITALFESLKESR